MPSKVVKSPFNFYPFTTTIAFSQLQIGKYTMLQRWQQLQIIAKQKLSNIPLYSLPTVALVEYILEHKKFPTHINKYCIALTNSIDFVKCTTAFIAIDVAIASARKGKKKDVQPLPAYIMHSGNNEVILEKDVVAKHCFLNTDDGPIYISKGSTIQEGVCLRGPIYVGQNTTIKMGATIYANTIIGNNCIVGGEVKNSIIMNNTNKAHYGYLGDSMVGEWCNLGAGTTNSNIKNNCSSVMLGLGSEEVNAGFKFGTLIGHYSRTAINTAINTGTVMGISCNIFANGLTPKILPNFSWGVTGQKYIFDKAINDIEKWMLLKNVNLNKATINQLKKIYNEPIRT